MCEIYSKYRRKQTNIDKAVFNDEVNLYFKLHYRYLYSRLVFKEEDKDTFNDTFLKLTYNYNSDKDFIDQFIYYFKLLKGAYYRDDKVEKYNLGNELDENIEDKVTEEEEPDSKDQLDICELKQQLLLYANPKKATKTKNKKH